MKSGRYFERNYTLRLSDWLYLYPKLDVEIIDNIHDSTDYLTKDYNNRDNFDDEMRDVAMGQGMYEESLNG
jgi:hypothetical protein